MSKQRRDSYSCFIPAGLICRRIRHHHSQQLRYLLLALLFFIQHTPVFSQTKDTIVDSNYSWIELQNKFRAQYFDSSKSHFTNNERQRIAQLIDMKLTLINVVYSGFDNRIHAGQIICNQSVASDIKQIFLELLQMRFPICQCKPVSEFDFIDTKSMENNNTTCFDFRLKTNSKQLSNHSYGLAIDINPVENPYKKRTDILPQNRNENIATGRIRITEKTGKQVIFIFKKQGWIWGGNWRSLQDFMHFEKKN